MKLKDLIDLGVNPDKVEEIWRISALNGKRLCVLQSVIFHPDLVSKINNSNGIYFKEYDPPPNIQDSGSNHLKPQIIRCCFK
jgi:hypothetical protein